MALQLPFWHLCLFATNIHAGTARLYKRIENSGMSLMITIVLNYLSDD